LQSYFCRSSLLMNSATPISTLAALKQQDSLFDRTDDDQQLGDPFGTSDWGLGTVVPLSEPVYWRLTRDSECPRE
jgi:cleavage and polyadenylation specificity factor subunit 1